MDKEKNESLLPKSTRELLEFLPTLYPVDELLSLYETRDEKTINEYIGKLKLIAELRQLLKDEDEESGMEVVLAR